MKGKLTMAFLVMLFLLAGLRTTLLFGGDWRFGLGVNVGVSKLEGDLPDASLSPLISGHLRVMPFPYLALNGELGFSALGSSTANNFETTIIPFELSAIFNLLPFNKLNPYLFVGGGGVFWSATADDTTGTNKTLDDGMDSFLKTGGGIEYRVSRNVSLNLGATFRFSLTDGFDQLWQGDENDQVLDVHGGLTYYFNRGGDRDHDLIPDELDLMPEIAEDQDGYLDHDGIPEKNPSPIAMNSYGAPFGNADEASPIVIHKIIVKAESGKDVNVKANVYSKVPLKVVAALYRPIGTRKWNVAVLEEANSNNLYQGEIPGYAVTTGGLEYCIVAVDETLTGVGYSGLPGKPINVTVSSSGTPWRIVGGAVGAASVGTASYLILRKQE